jgi:SAM-dependent MidA family methyltransferase
VGGDVLQPNKGQRIEVNAMAVVAGKRSRTSGWHVVFAPREYYMPTRSTGTLACHYRHRVHFDPLAFIGLQDVTAHVDFTAMAEAAVDNGASVCCFATQANFLLRTGLLNSLESAEFASEKERIIATSAVQKLVSPAEMGELFKVLVVTKGEAGDQLAAFAEFDESYRL